MALTATAPPRVRQDIVDILKMRDVKYFTGTHNRRNIRLETRKKDARVLDRLVTFLRDPNYANKCGIIYCTTR